MRLVHHARTLAAGPEPENGPGARDTGSLARKRPEPRRRVRRRGQAATARDGAEPQAAELLDEVLVPELFESEDDFVPEEDEESEDDDFEDDAGELLDDAPRLSLR
ncbi:hypothetical protein GCM10010238_18610 [Streptomyces griseoviridis]|uniref:Uncharacterized protein n=1 Tax=Streptomyces griseoviridis TaxID=45398 RepID=A0A918LC56_STRGD|nr:hypothetical protein GCM10010238_18610 [Streptomyces niveoruber]